MATRQHKRIKMSGVVDIWSNNGERIDEIFGASKMAFCLVKDISIGGLGVFSTTPIEKGAAVSIKRFNFNKRVYQEHIIGRVVWIDGKEKAYHMGIAFEGDISRDKCPTLYAAIFGHQEALTSRA